MDKSWNTQPKTNGIRNWDNHSVKLDFKNLRFGPQQNMRPSDIDMFFLYGKLLIIGDGKNSIGIMGDGQRKIYERLIDRWCEAYGHKGLYMWFSHNSFQQNGDTTVDVANCEVVEYYWHDGIQGRWLTPKTKITVEEAMTKVLPSNINNEYGTNTVKVTTTETIRTRKITQYDLDREWK